MEDSEDESSSDSSDKEDDDDADNDADMFSGSEKPETDEGTDDGVVDVFHPRHALSPPKITYLVSPPKLIKNLDASAPSNDLIQAIGAMSLSSLHMQKARRLPFLCRNLRRGFFQRCRSLGIPCDPRSQAVPVNVRYEHRTTPDIIDNFFVTRMEALVCPLCQLHGTFNTREMLASHLTWDHTEVKARWEQVGAAAVSFNIYVYS
jgi:hypothetical protein